MSEYTTLEMALDEELEEEEYSVTVTASYGVMAESQESANQYILQQFQNGNTGYTGDVEVSE